MGRIADGTVLNLQYSPKTKVGVSGEESLLRIKEAFSGNPEVTDAALIQLHKEPFKKTDNEALVKGYGKANTQEGGIKYLQDILSRQQGILSKLSTGNLKTEVSDALKEEFNALITEYNRTYESLSANRPEDLLLSGKINVELDALKNGFSYNIVNFSTSTLTTSAGAGSTSSITSSTSSTNTALESGGTAGTFIVDQSGAATVDLTAEPASSTYASGEGLGALSGSYSSTDVDTTGDTITLTGHGLTTGDAIQFSSLSSEESYGQVDIGRIYHAIVVDADTIRLAVTEANALSNQYIDIDAQPVSTVEWNDIDLTTSIYDPTNDTISLVGNTYLTGQKVTLSAAAGDSLPLTQLQAEASDWNSEANRSTTYYVISQGDDIKLASSYEDAINGIAVDFASYGFGQLTISTTGNFDAVSDTVMLESHGYLTGETIELSGDGLPTGLTAGQQYFVIRSDSDSFQLAASYADAIGGTAIDFTSDGDFGILGERTDYSGGGDSILVDLDNDTYMDMVYRSGTTVGVRLGQADGSFSVATTYTVSDPGLSTSGFVSAADIDEDGNLDLVVSGENGFEILQGDGSGNFSYYGDGTVAASSTYFSLTNARNVTSGDFNGDGIMDLANGDLYLSEVQIRLGNGDGTFGAAATFAISGGGRQIVVGDLNGDGILDLATDNYYSANIDVLIGNGDGTFQTAVTYAVDANARALTIGDLNGDQYDDLAVAVEGGSLNAFLGGSSFLTGTASEVTGTQATSIQIADFDNDGNGDIVVGHVGVYDVSYHKGNGDGTFAVQVSYSTGIGDISSLTAGDFDSDGNMDLAAVSFDSINVLGGVGDGTFSSGASYSKNGYGFSVITTGDFNTDGILDFTVGSYGSEISILLGDGDGNFSTRNTYSATGVVGVTAGDFNGDGIDDIASGNQVFTIDKKTYSGVSGASQGVLVRDVGGDGDLDIIGLDSGNVVVFTGGGNGTFLSTVSTFTATTGASYISEGDLDNDGDTDLVVSGPSGGDFVVLEGDATSTFVTGSSYTDIGSFSADKVELVDLNNDGFLDSVSVGGSVLNADMNVRLGNGDGTFGAVTSYSTGLDFSSIAAVYTTAGDLNQDGHEDIIVSGDSKFKVFLSNGDGTFTEGVSGSLGGVANSNNVEIALLDADGDTILDIVGTSRTISPGTSDSLVVLSGQGDGTFGAIQSYSIETGDYSKAIDAADLDGDGELDFVIGGKSVLLSLDSNPIQVLSGSGSSEIDTTNDTVTITAHGLATGTRVRVSSSGTLPTELLADTDYYIISQDANTIKLATSEANALLGTAIDLTGTGNGTLTIEAFNDSSFDETTDEITLAAHGLTAGQRIQFNGTGTTPTGLDKATDYYAIVTGDPDVFKVAASYEDAIAEIAIDFSGTPSGDLELTEFDSIDAYDSTTDAINLTAHGFVTGQRIQFSDSQGDLPTGISAGVDYYAIAVDADHFQVAATYADAIALTAIDISGSSSGTTYVSAVGASNFDPTVDTITIASHGLSSGQRVELQTASQYGYLPTGLTGQEYYVIKVDNNTIKLAYSEEDALAGTAIDFSGYGSFDIKIVAYSESISSGSTTIGSFDLDSELGLMSATETLNNISSGFASISSESTAITSRLRGISAYSQESGS